MRQAAHRLLSFYRERGSGLRVRYGDLHDLVIAETDLSLQHPFLMHALRAITEMHDRCLVVSHTTRQSQSEVHHWSRAVTLFNQALSTKIHPDDRDAIFATASLLGIASVASFDLNSSNDAWPLKQSQPADLSWMGMCRGKKALYDLIDPMRADSIFRPLLESLRLAQTPECGIEGIPPEFVQLYGLETSSTAESSPYYAALRALVPLLRMQCSDDTIANYFAFILYLPLQFDVLLARKDPRALLLLAYWYAKVCHSQWWLARRATLECQATCLYLEKYHSDEKVILQLLQVPRTACGLVQHSTPDIC